MSAPKYCLVPCLDSACVVVPFFSAPPACKVNDILLAPFWLRLLLSQNHSWRQGLKAWRMAFTTLVAWPGSVRHFLSVFCAEGGQHPCRPLSGFSPCGDLEPSIGSTWTWQVREPHGWPSWLWPRGSKSCPQPFLILQRRFSGAVASLAMTPANGIAADSYVLRRSKPTPAWYGDALLAQFGPFCRVLCHRALPNLVCLGEDCVWKEWA